MISPHLRAPLAAALTLALGLPSGAFAYGKKDAERDCENRLRDEYGLSDFRHESAEEIEGASHSFRVAGKVKVDGEKYPFTCEVKDRHVTSVSYDGPEPEGMKTSEKLAIGAAAAVAAGLIASQLGEDKDEDASPTGKYTTADYDATTILPCSMGAPTHTDSCPAGIRRGKGGAATIHVTPPGGRERTLEFRGDDVTTPHGDLTWGKDGGEWYIGIDNREFYIVPEAAIYGG